MTLRVNDHLKGEPDMSQSAADDPTIEYRVVRNDEEQCSIWAVDRDLPAGWHEEGTVGTRQACLDRISQIWPDIRPLSLRRSMNE